MFKKLNILIFKPNLRLRYYSLAPLPNNNEEQIRKLPKITCKRTNLNLLGTEIIKPNIKFGDIPLVSNGWKHRKSKGDFFKIHALEDYQICKPYRNLNSLNELKISNEFIENLKNEFNIENITQIQDESIQQIQNMNHVLIAAETGCGKTLAYLLPILQQILTRKRNGFQTKDFNTPLGLILTPGRELAEQIGNVAERLCQGTDIKIKTILGGNTKQKMLNPEFEDIDLLIGSIGVISKLTTNQIYRMKQVRHVVLDEADTLLDDSFSDKLCYFLRRFPFHKNHIQDLNDKIIGTQLILVSATMPTNIQDLLSRVINTETIHEIISSNLHYLMLNITHNFIRMNKSDRPSQLLTLVKTELRKNHPLIIFGNKTSTCDFISIFLNNHGVNCINLNGDMPKNFRYGQFEKFQNGDYNVLSTTDVASRGLDTTRAKHVINFDFPLHVSDYIHRCGRIGRAGVNNKKCYVTNFISSLREIELVQKIEHSARTGNLLPNVNANITNIIKQRIIKNIGDEELVNIL